MYCIHKRIHIHHYVVDVTFLSKEHFWIWIWISSYHQNTGMELWLSTFTLAWFSGYKDSTVYLLWRCLITVGWARVSSTSLVSWHTDHAITCIYRALTTRFVNQGSCTQAWAKFQTHHELNHTHEWVSFMHNRLATWSLCTCIISLPSQSVMVSFRCSFTETRSYHPCFNIHVRAQWVLPSVFQHTCVCTVSVTIRVSTYMCVHSECYHLCFNIHVRAQWVLPSVFQHNCLCAMQPY